MVNQESWKLLTQASSKYASRYWKAQEDEEKRRKGAVWAEKELELNNGGKENPDGTVTPKENSNWFKDLGVMLGAGVQQMGGSLADTLVQGGALLRGVALKIDPFVSDEKRSRLEMASQRGTESTRNWIGDREDISGANIDNRRTDEAADRLSRGEFNARDVASVGGRALGDAATATMFLNPTTGAVRTGSSAATGKAAVGAGTFAKGALKEAATFGTIDGVSAASEVWGEGGTGGEALQAGVLSGALSSGASFGLNVGGRAAGRAVGNAIHRAKTNVPADLRDAHARRLQDESVVESLTPKQQNTYANRLTELGQSLRGRKDGRTDTFNTEADKILEEVRSTSGTRGTEAASGPDPELEAEIDRLNEELSELSSGDSEAFARYTGGDGTDLTAVKQKYDDEVADLEAEIDRLNEVAEGSRPAEGVDPSADTSDVNVRASAAEEIPRLRQEIQEIKAREAEEFDAHGGVKRSMDTEALSARVADITEQRSDLTAQRVTQRLSDMSAREAKDMAGDINSGVVPEDLVTVRPPASSGQEAFARAIESDPDDVTGVQQAYATNELHRAAAQEKLDNLWTEEDATRFGKNLDDNYNQLSEQINELPGPKQQMARERLDELYNSKAEQNQARLDEDADEVLAAYQAMKVLDDIDVNIAEQWNSLESMNPNAFGQLDGLALQRVQDEVSVKATTKAVDEGESVQVSDQDEAVTKSLANVDSPEQAGRMMDEDPGLSKATQNVMKANGMYSGVDFALRSPRGVFKNMGEPGKEILDQLETSMTNKAKDSGELMNRIETNRWKSTWGKKYKDQTIKFLDEGKELKRMNGESKAHFDTRQKATNDIRKWFDEEGKKLGLSPEQMRKNYFPHMFERVNGVNPDTVGEAIARLKSNRNANGNKLTENQKVKYQRQLAGIDLRTRQSILKNNIFKVGKNGHLEKRQGAEGWSDNIEFVIREYHEASMKKRHIEPSLNKINEVSTRLNEAQMAYAEDFARTLKGQPIRIDQIFEKSVKVSSVVRKYSNMALMGLSGRTVALQLGGLVNNYVESGSLGSFVVGGLRALPIPGKPNRLRSLAMENGVYQDTFPGYLRGGQGLTTAQSKLENAMFSGISFVDTQLRTQAFDMGRQDYMRSINKAEHQLTKAELEAANEAGVARANKSQFTMGELDIPLGQSTEVGKLITQIQQFNIKQSQYEFRKLFGSDADSMIYKTKDGKVHLSKKGAERVVKTVAGYAALYTLMTQVAFAGKDSENFFGFDVEDLLPFGEQVVWAADKAGSLFGLTEGDMELEAPMPIFLSLLFGRGGGQDRGLIGDASDLASAGEEDDPSAARSDAMSRLAKRLYRSFVPAGTQQVRSKEGLEAVLAGESVNRSGSTRFLIDNESGWNVVKGLVAGQYATREGREWLENGMNTISANNKVELSDGTDMPVSEYVREYVKDPEQQAAWIGYYSTKQHAQNELSEMGMGRDDYLRNVRLKLTAGRINEQQANMEIEKYNNIVRELYRPFKETIEEWPPRLSADFLENVMIMPGNSTPIRLRTMDQEKQQTLRAWEEYETR